MPMPAAPSAVTWQDALPSVLHDMQERAPVLLIFLRHFG